MMDNRLLQGLLIAASVCLLFSIAMSWGDIDRYKRVGEPGAVSTTPAPAGAPAPRAAAGPLPDVLGVVYADVQSVVGSALVQSMAAQAGGVPEEVQGIGAFSLFLLPPEVPTGELGGYAIVKLEGAALQEAKDGMAEVGAAGTVEGLQAFQPPGSESWITITEDGTLIFASSEAQLGEAVRAHVAQDLPDPEGEAFALANAYADAPIRGGFVVVEQMREQIPAEALASLADAKGMAFGITVAADLQLGVLFRFDEAAGAEAAAAEINAALAEQKEQLSAAQADPMAAMMMAPLAGLLDKVQISAQGTDCRISMALNEQDAQALLPMVMMMGMAAMMGGGAEGEMMPMPAGPPGMPGAPLEMPGGME